MGRYPFSNVGVSGNITSVFGRTGSVVATTGDYTVAQVTGAAPLTAVPFLPIPGIAPSTNIETAFAAALTALGSTPGTLTITVPGTYTYTSPKVFGAGQGLVTVPGVVLAYTGSGVAMHSFDAAFDINNTSPLVSIGGQFSGFIIDMSGAAAGSKGFQIGDQNHPNVQIGVRGANGAGSIGGWIASTIGWINYGSIEINTNDCTNHIVFDGSAVGGGTALGGVSWSFTQTANPNQNGIVAKGLCQVVGGKFSLFGEYLGALTTNTGSVFLIGAADASGFTNFSSFNVNAECNTGAGNVGPVTIALGSTAFFYANLGQLIFRNQGSGAFQASTGLSTTLSWGFKGFVRSQASGDYLGDPYAAVGVLGWAGTLRGADLEQIGVVDGSNFYVSSGSLFNLALSAGANTRAMFGSAPTYGQEITLFLTAGAASTLTITGVLTPSGAGLIGPTSATAGFVDVVKLTWNGTNWAQASVTLHEH